MEGGSRGCLTCHSSGLPTPLILLTDCNNMHCLQSRSTLKNDSTGHPPTILTPPFLPPPPLLPCHPSVLVPFRSFDFALRAFLFVYTYFIFTLTLRPSLKLTPTPPPPPPLSSLRSSCAKAFSRLNFATPLHALRTRVRVVFSGYFVFLCSLCLFSFSFPFHFSFRFVCPFLKNLYCCRFLNSIAECRNPPCLPLPTSVLRSQPLCERVKHSSPSG